MVALTALCAAVAAGILFAILGYIAWKGASSLSWAFLTRLPAPVGHPLAYATSVGWPGAGGSPPSGGAPPAGPPGGDRGGGATGAPPGPVARRRPHRS